MEDERTKYKILYRQAWNQYNIYFQTYSLHSNKFNTIGAVSSIFILVLVTLAEAEEGSKWFYMPVVFLLVPFIVTLINLMKGFKIPWFKREKLEDQISEGEVEFFKHQIEDIYKSHDTLLAYKKWAKRWSRVSVWFIFAGLAVSVFLLARQYLPPLFCRLTQGPVSN